MTVEVYMQSTTRMQDQAVHALGSLYKKIDSQSKQEDSTETRKALSDAG
jgi:hypothetical protein